MKLLKNLFFAVLCNLLVFGYTYAKEKTPEFIDETTRVSAEELIDLVESTPDLVIIDARKKSDYEKGHIEGAHSLPNTDTTKDTLANLVPSKDHSVLFYCNGVNCGRSVESCKKAIGWGYSNIYWFRGGIEEWLFEDLPVIR